MPEKQLTSEQKKLQEEVRKEAKKEGIPQKDIEKLEDIAGVIGGMGETSKKVLVGSVIALSGAAAGALAIWSGKKAFDKYKGKVTVSADELGKQSSALTAARDTAERQSALLNGGGRVVLRNRAGQEVPLPDGVISYSVESLPVAGAPDGYDSSL